MPSASAIRSLSAAAFRRCKNARAVDYLEPRLFGSRDLDIDFSALYDDSRDVRTFGAKREEARGTSHAATDQSDHALLSLRVSQCDRQ